MLELALNIQLEGLPGQGRLLLQHVLALDKELRLRLSQIGSKVVSSEPHVLNV